MTYLQPLHMNWLLFAAGLFASVAGAAAVTYGTVPLLSIRSAWQASGRYRRTVWIGTIAFALSHLFAPLALNMPVVSSYYFLHVLFTLAGCYAATLFNFRYAGRPRGRVSHYYITGFAISAIILAFDYANTLFLFRGMTAWRPMLAAATAATVCCLMLSILRVLDTSNRNREHNLHSRATVPGFILSGLGLFAVPLLCAFSVLPAAETRFGGYAILTPYLLTLFSCIGLHMIPDSYNTTRQSRQNQRIVETEQHYMSLFEHNPDSVLAFDSDGRITGVNRQAELLAERFGTKPIGLHFSDLFEGEYHDQAMRHYKEVLRGKSSTIELQAKAMDGKTHAFWLTSLPIFVDGTLRGAYSVMKDISNTKKDQETIRHLAYHDELTGLANRRFFQDFLVSRTDAKSAAAQRPFIVFFIDLDRFKRVNDLFGHAFGDEVIKQAAAKLRGCLPSNCTLARMGGDEFTVLLPNLSAQEEIGQAAAAVVHEFTHPFRVGHRAVKLSASLGIARYPEDGRDAESLLKHADTAMYNAKENGSAQYRFYDAERDQTSMEQITLEQDLEQSIASDQMRLYYQPKIDIRTGEATGVEALVRWEHPQLGLIPPLSFIPLAEKSGFIVPLELWVLREACKQIRQWGERRLRPRSRGRQSLADSSHEARYFRIDHVHRTRVRRGSPAAGARDH
ncbi:diguanylate cyclase [Cohnella ginsengisoli]|uniref:Diguanylate cyclase n=1 Tax=Cohnella ginsengisoli TaxID=425004 RepID=A0A9X4QLW7_9BACL|nr:diguanylate cyclase [Cohnella ginsengisoli]MDG0791269.1 diguanylate cyclase [Cohnella ginsengisoli]